MVDTCLVTGVMVDAKGVALPNQSIFVKPNGIMTASGGAVLPADTVVITGSDGAFSGSFVPGIYRMTWWHTQREYSCGFLVPDEPSADLSACISGAGGVPVVPLPGPRGLPGTNMPPTSLVLEPGPITSNSGLFFGSEITGVGDRHNNGFFYINLAESASNDSAGRSLDGQTINYAIQDGAGAGNRTAATFTLSGNGEIAPMTASGQDFRTALFLKAYMNANEGGTAVDPLGNYFGLGVISKIDGNNCHAESCIGAELNVLVEETSTVKDVACLQLISINDHAVKGWRTDAALVIAAQGTVTAKFDYGIAFGRAGSDFPVDGTLVGAYSTTIDARSCQYGVDFGNVTFSEAAFRSPGFQVNPSGAVRSSVGFEAFTSSLPVDAGGLVRWAGSSTGLRLQVNTSPAGDFSTAATRVNIGHTGLFGIGVTDPSAILDLGGDKLRLRTKKTPSSATAAGNAGDSCWDDNYEYRCIATNTWQRWPRATW